MNRLAFALFVMLAAAVHTASASAASIDVTFSGQVTTPYFATNYNFAVGDAFTVKFRIDDAAADQNPDPNMGFYPTVTNLSGTFSNGYSFTSPLTYFLGVGNNNGPQDYVVIDAAGLTAPDLDGKALRQISIEFFGNAAMLPGDAIPDMGSLMSISDARGMSMVFGNYDFAIGTEIFSTSAVSATPIPAALPLLASALGGLGYVGWRRRKTSLAAS